MQKTKIKAIWTENVVTSLSNVFLCRPPRRLSVPVGTKQALRFITFKTVFVFPRVNTRTHKVNMWNNPQMKQTRMLNVFQANRSSFGTLARHDYAQIQKPSPKENGTVSRYISAAVELTPAAALVAIAGGGKGVRISFLWRSGLVKMPKGVCVSTATTCWDSDVVLLFGFTSVGVEGTLPLESVMSSVRLSLAALSHLVTRNLRKATGLWVNTRVWNCLRASGREQMSLFPLYVVKNFDLLC